MDRQKSNSLLESVKHTLSCEAQEIERLIHTLDDQQIIEAAEMILRCSGKVILSGCGTSGTAGEKIAHTLSCIEIPAFFLSPAKAAHGGMGVIQREDVVILISKGKIVADGSAGDILSNKELLEANRMELPLSLSTRGR